MRIEATPLKHREILHNLCTKLGRGQYSRIFDNNGTEYKTSAIKVANSEHTMKFVRDLPTEVTLSFKDVDDNAKLVSLLELSFAVYGTSEHPVAKFRNLVIK